MSIRLLLVSQDPGLASTRVRVEQMAPHLAEQGLRTECLPYPASFRAKRALWRRRAQFDLVLLQEKLLSSGEALFWRALGVALVFDFDDALPFRHRPKRGSAHSATRARRFRRTLDVATGVVAGNPYLAALAEAAGKPVHVAPSAVPFPVPRRTTSLLAGALRVGWIGSSGNLDSLVSVAPALRTVARETPLRLVVIADRAPELDGVDVEHRRWSLATQDQDLAELDVGLMPLEDTPWNRGKCAYKLLQYMAAGVPCLASPVGMNAELIADGDNGLLATGDAQWAEALRRLAADEPLRARLGAAGLRTVADSYTYPVVARGLAAYLRGLLVPLPVAN